MIFRKRKKEFSWVRFEDFYDQYVETLLRYCYGYLKSWTEAEEAVHDIMLKFWKNVNRIESHQAAKSYLFKLCKHHLLNLLRDKARYSTLPLLDETNEPIATQSVEHQYVYMEALGRANNTIAQLPPKRKMVYELKVKSGLTNNQIASKMAISTTMVEKHWQKAVNQIRQAVNASK